MRFTSVMENPNVYPNGHVCVSILHTPGDDPSGYEAEITSKNKLKLERTRYSLNPVVSAIPRLIMA